MENKNPNPMSTNDIASSKRKGCNTDTNSSKKLKAEPLHMYTLVRCNATVGMDITSPFTPKTLEDCNSKDTSMKQDQPKGKINGNINHKIRKSYAENCESSLVRSNATIGLEEPSKPLNSVPDISLQIIDDFENLFVTSNPYVHCSNIVRR